MFKVMTATIGSPEDCWSDGNDKPTRYKSIAAAWHDIIEHVADCRAAYKLGHLSSYPSYDDFTIERA